LRSTSFFRLNLAERSQTPTSDHLTCLQVNNCDHAPILEIDEDLASPVRCQKFGCSSKLDRRFNLAEFWLWSAIVDEVRLLPEREDVGRAPEHEEAARLLKACFESNQPSLYPAVVVYCNTGVRSAELRCARWSQVNFAKREFQVGKAKTPNGDGRIIPLNQTAMDAFMGWRALWPDAKPTDFIFPSEKLFFKGEGSAKLGVMSSHELDRTKPLGSWKRAWTTAKKRAGVECRLHDLRHYFLTNLAESKVSDSTVLALAGHLSRKMLERYSHIRAKAKREAIESMERRNKLFA
jgi:integrase